MVCSMRNIRVWMLRLGFHMICPNCLWRIVLIRLKEIFLNCSQYFTKKTILMLTTVLSLFKRTRKLPVLLIQSSPERCELQLPLDYRLLHWMVSRRYRFLFPIQRGFWFFLQSGHHQQFSQLVRDHLSLIALPLSWYARTGSLGITGNRKLEMPTQQFTLLR